MIYAEQGYYMKIDENIVAQAVRNILEQKGQGARSGAGVPFGMSAYLGGQPVHVSASVTLDFAEKLMKRVEGKAKEMGMRVVTAVADAHGNPIAVRCMEDAFIGSFDVALNKTYTAIAFKMSTEELGALSQPGEPLYGIQFTNQNRIVIFGGGIPLRMGDSIIGAFGVSGGSAQQDTYLAHFAEEAFREMTNQNGRT